MILLEFVPQYLQTMQPDAIAQMLGQPLELAPVAERDRPSKPIVSDF